MDSIEILIYNETTKPPDITFVELISPFNGQMIDNTSVTFFWQPVNLSKLEAESMMYDIYLYKYGEPQELIIEKYVGTNISFLW